MQGDEQRTMGCHMFVFRSSYRRAKILQGGYNRALLLYWSITALFQRFNRPNNQANCKHVVQRANKLVHAVQEREQVAEG